MFALLLITTCILPTAILATFRLLLDGIILLVIPLALVVGRLNLLHTGGPKQYPALLRLVALPINVHLAFGPL
jgi:hypothetical protein